MKFIPLFESFDNSRNENKSLLEKEAPDSPKNVEAKEDLDDSFDKKQKKVEDELDGLFKKLVPSSGAAETVEGEMVRAIMRVWYRYFNDGDYFFRGYGKETAKPSVDWLCQVSPLKDYMKDCFADAKAEALPDDSRSRRMDQRQYTKDDGYLKNIIEAAEEIVGYIKEQNGKYTPMGETPDSRDYESKYARKRSKYAAW